VFFFFFFFSQYFIENMTNFDSLTVEGQK